MHYDMALWEAILVFYTGGLFTSTGTWYYPVSLLVILPVSGTGVLP